MHLDNDTYFAACASEGIRYSSPLAACNAKFSTSFTSNENGAVDCSRKHSHLMPPPEPDILAQGSTLSAALVVGTSPRAMPLSEDQQMILTYQCVIQAGRMARFFVKVPPPHSRNRAQTRFAHCRGERDLDHRIVGLEFVDLLHHEFNLLQTAPFMCHKACLPY